MIGYQTEIITEKDKLDLLYENSALTIEGLTEESIPDFVNWLEENTTFTNNEPIIYIIKGKTMNKEYRLHSTNAYQDDLTIVSVMDINPLPIVIKRFTIGARWFDDIVDNNRRRESD